MIKPITPIVVAVASMRPPKLEGVRQAFADFSARSVNRSDVQSAAQSAALTCESQTFEVVGADVPSGVRHTPLSREEMMAGARQRAEALLQLPRANQERWTYFVGLEGGLDVIQLPAHGPDQPTRFRPGQRPGQRLVLLENWAYICDAGGNGAYGQSGAVALPTQLATRVVDDGVELAEAIDAFADSKGVRDGPGAWGVLTGNLVTRQDAIRLSVINALSALFRERHFGTGPTIRGR